jgi:hypothetical protein
MYGSASRQERDPTKVRTALDLHPCDCAESEQLLGELALDRRYLTHHSYVFSLEERVKSLEAIVAQRCPDVDLASITVLHPAPRSQSPNTPQQCLEICRDRRSQLSPEPSSESQIQVSNNVPPAQPARYDPAVGLVAIDSRVIGPSQIAISPKHFLGV